MLSKKMPARLESLPELLAFTAGLAEKNGFAPPARQRIELVVEEALVNVFTHAYKKTAGDVEIRCVTAAEGTLTIEIRDSGVSFNPLGYAAPNLHADLAHRKIGGLGVFFIRQMTNQLTYRREGTINSLTLTFFNH